MNGYTHYLGAQLIEHLEASAFEEHTAEVEVSELLIRRAVPNATALIDAVSTDNQDACAEVLTTLTTAELHALAIVLASYCAPETQVDDVTTRAVSLAAIAFRIAPAYITSENRDRPTLDARCVAAYAARLLGVTYAQIGRVLNRDHSTVMNACSRVGADPRLRRIAQNVATDLGWQRDTELPLLEAMS